MTSSAFIFAFYPHTFLLNKTVALYEVSDFLKHIGGEGAFLVSRETAKAKECGMKIYPFNLGDIDGKEVTPPPGYRQGLVKAALEAPLTYGPTQGLPALRTALAKKMGAEYGIEVDLSHVSISASKSNIFKTEMMLLNRDSPFAYPVPGYPIYESVAKSKQAQLKPYSFTFTPNPLTQELEVDIDIESVKRSLDGGAKVLVLNDAQNPSGHTLSEASVNLLKNLLTSPEYSDVFVMFDIAYENIRFDGVSHVRTLIKELFEQGRAGILGTASKEDAITGERLGFTVFPKTPVTGNPAITTLVEAFNKLTSNIESSSPSSTQLAWLEAFGYGKNLPQNSRQFIFNTHTEFQRLIPQIDSALLGFISQGVDATTPADQWLGLQVQMNKIFADVGRLDPNATQEANLQKNLTILKERRDLLCEELQGIDGLFATKPNAGFYVWADVTQLMENLGFGKDTETFRKTVLAQTGVSFCSDIHFGDSHLAYPNQRFVRFAFSGIGKDDIREAMGIFKAWVDTRLAARDYFKSKQIAVIGGGPIGQVTAHRLQNTVGDVAGVSIVTRYSKGQIDAKGIRLTLPVPLLSKPNAIAEINELDGPQDVIFLSTQLLKFSGDVQRLVADLMPKLKQNTIIVCLQNGIDTGKELALALSPNFPNVVVARSIISVQIRDGLDEHRREDGSFSIPKEISWPIGPVLKIFNQIPAERLEDLGKALCGAGMKKMNAVSYETLRVLAWEKLIKNLGNYAALELATQGKGLTYGDVLQDSPEGKAARGKLKAAVGELISLAHDMGVSLEKSAEEYCKDVLKYLETSHICTTVNAFRKGKEMENLLSPLLINVSVGYYATLVEYSKRVDKLNQTKSLYDLK
jgi:aspartate/methionine/tyrosine aminotransferase/ketopantoate reductase